jgi:hypothetical protein
MASQKRILNTTNGFHYKRGAVERAIEACSVAWVEYGISVRSLTVAESIAARNDQASRREPLPFAEIPGIKFVPPVSGVQATGREGMLLWQAHDFVMQAA